MKFYDCSFFSNDNDETQWNRFCKKQQQRFCKKQQQHTTLEHDIYVHEWKTNAFKLRKKVEL